MMYTPTLRELIKLIVLEEGRVREAHISGGRRVPWGSNDHIEDLERRVSDAEWQRDAHPRRSIKRYHWGTVLRQLKEELRSAKKTNKTLNEKDEV